MTFTIRWRHVLVALAIVVAAGATFLGTRLARSSHPAASPPPSHHTTTSSVRPAAHPATTATATTPTTVPTTTTTTEPLPVLSTSDGGSVIEPATIYFGGAANDDLTNITWSTWGPATASGTGQGYVNNCTPDCAEGTVITDTFTVTLSQPENGMFTVLTTTDTSDPSTGAGFSDTYPSLWPVNATLADGPLQGSG
jgi:hypothetical protein